MADTQDKPTSETSAVDSSAESAGLAAESAEAAISLDELVSNTAGAVELAKDLGAPETSDKSESASSGADASAPARSTSDPGFSADAEKAHSVAGAPVPGAPIGNHAPTESSIPVPDPLQVIEQVDRVLTIEDPSFLASLDEIKDIGKGGAELPAILPESHDLGLEEDAPPHSWASVMKARKNGVKPFAVEFLGWFKYHLKTVLGAVGGIFKSVFGAFKGLRALAKVMVFGVIALTVALILVLKVGLLAKSGHRLGLPVIEASFLGEFATHADHVFEYDDEAQKVNFLDPMLHPENVVLVDHIVVNLKASSAHENPMALIDFYIEAGSKDAAIEVKQRDVEVRDSMSRVIEQISYEDITTDAGKYKLKVILRKTLNDFMTTGRVRRIYFKTFVLKP